MNLIDERMVDWLIDRAGRTPYEYLIHPDGTPYMGRYWLMPMSLLVPGDCGYGYELVNKHLPAIRLHHIQSADVDRELHSHPWPFLSRVLRGGYAEQRPVYPQPTFYKTLRGSWEEQTYVTWRQPGSWAFRWSGDRHRISDVKKDTWTLVLTGPRCNQWGFATMDGFIPWPGWDAWVAQQIRLGKRRVPGGPCVGAFWEAAPSRSFPAYARCSRCKLRAESHA